MEAQSTKIQGSVQSTKHEGVFGLKILFHSKDKRIRDRLGTTWTKMDGSFTHYFLGEPGEIISEGDIKFGVEIQDRDGDTVYQSEERFSDIKETELDIEIGEKLLENHFSRALTWDCPKPPLLPENVKYTIERAIDTLSETGAIFDQKFQGLISFEYPPITNFPNAAIDAWRSLQGMHDASERFQIMLNVLEYKSSGYREVASTLRSERASDELEKGLRTELEFTQMMGKLSVGNMSYGLDLESTQLLMMAAMRCGYPDKSKMKRNIDVIRVQLRGLKIIDFIYQLSIGTLSGDRERTQFFEGIIKIVPPDFMGGRGEWPPFDEIPEIPPDRIHPEEIIPDFGETPIDPCITAYAEALERWTNGVEYKINEIDPDMACPGEMIYLRGSGFGDFPGTVRFSMINLTSPDNYVDAEPEFWSEDYIQVRVPDDAGCGPISLQIQVATEVVCERLVEIYKVGSSREQFGGGLPDIKYLSVSPYDMVHHEGEWKYMVTPGEEITLHWAVCPAPMKYITVRIEIWEAAREQEFSDLLGEGYQVIPVPESTETRTLTCHFMANNRCGTTRETLKLLVHRPTIVTLDGIEVTQATQFFRVGEHMPNPEEGGPDNSIPLIANKAMMVRVYFSADPVSDPAWDVQVDNVGVYLMGYQGGEPLLEAPLHLSELSAVTDDSVKKQRGFGRKNKAEFIFPSYWLQPGDPISFISWLDLPDDDINDVDPSSREVFGLSVKQAEPLRIVLIRINHNGIGAPSLEECIQDLEFARACFPTYDIEYKIPRLEHRVIDADDDLDSKWGWSNLWSRIHKIASNYEGDSRVVYCGVLSSDLDPEEISGVGDTARHALGVACYTANHESAAHEIGHAYGLKHPVGTESLIDNEELDNNFPDYGYPSRYSIGEFGMNLNGGWVREPDIIEELMSYSEGSKWFSPYYYLKLLDRFTAICSFLESLSEENPTAVSKSRKDRSEYMHVCGTIDKSTDEVRLQNLYHAPSYQQNDGGRSTEYTIVLIDPEEKILRQKEIRDLGPLNDQEIVIAQSIPYHKSAASIEIRKENKTITRIERPKGRLEVSSLVIEDQESGFSLKWKGKHSEKVNLLYGVAFTYDGGKNWHTLAKPLRKSNFEIARDQLFGGEECFFRVYACDGFNTQYIDSDVFQLPLLPPIIVPANFKDGDVVAAQEAMDLHIAVISEQFREIVPEQIQWEDGKEELLGTGQTISFTPRDGKNSIRIRASESPGCTSEILVTIIGE